MNGELLEKVQQFQNLLISEATGGSTNPEDYRKLRDSIVGLTHLRAVTPVWVRSCRTAAEFWSFIQPKFSTYKERRRFIWEEFSPLLERAERLVGSPADDSMGVVLSSFDPAAVHEIWAKALERRESDPEGAITLARTLLESVCKHLLEEHGVSYAADSDLPGLYKMVSKTLNLAPSQHSEVIFKQILGGCTAVVEGLGALRNRLSDAHGHGKKPVRPSERHAELAVNMAGTVATFLVKTHQSRGKSEIPGD